MGILVTKRKNFFKPYLQNWQLYLILLIPTLWLIIFKYVPIAGILLAFKDYSIRKGIWDSPWAGLKYFKMFFDSPSFWSIFSNTLSLKLYAIIAGFPIPIIFAFAINECSNVKAKKFVQTISFAPYFVSVVVVVGIMSQLFHYRFGALNIFLKTIGIEPVNLLSSASSFSHMYVWSGIWQGMGYSAVIYIAALTAVDPALREAATVDGASRMQIVAHVDFPSILPTIVITLILALGNLMSIGFEKVYIMQNTTNLAKSEIIATYVYKVGIMGAQYSFATAIGVFNSVVNLILIVFFNSICKKWGETSLW